MFFFILRVNSSITERSCIGRKGNIREKNDKASGKLDEKIADSQAREAICKSDGTWQTDRLAHKTRIRRPGSSWYVKVD